MLFAFVYISRNYKCRVRLHRTCVASLAVQFHENHLLYVQGSDSSTARTVRDNYIHGIVQRVTQRTYGAIVLDIYNFC